MRTNTIRNTVLIAGVLALSGCAAPSREQVFDPVRKGVEQRSGIRPEWPPGDHEQHAHNYTTEAFADGELTVEEAERIAMLRNPELMARLERLGIARAKLIEATLLPNPVLDAELKFVEAGGGEIIELAATQSIIDALLIPLRRQVAESRLEQAQADLVGDVLDLATETRTVYRRLQGQEQLTDLYRHAADATYLAADMSDRLREAGNIPRVDADRDRAAHEEMKLRLAASKARTDQLRGELALLMGLVGPNATAWTIPDRLPPPEPLGLHPDRVEQRAIAMSVDLESSHAEVTALGHRAHVEKIEAIFPDLAAGAAAEREADGTWAAGPGASVSIPVFNWGQAASAEQRSRLRQAYRRYTALAHRVRHTARARYTESESSAARATHLRDTVVPLRSEVTQRTQEQFNAMQIGVFDLLDAKRREIGAAESYIGTLREHWVARTELESILLGRLPRGGYGLDVQARGGGQPGGGGTEGEH